MNFYKQYSMMYPYVGEHFHDANTPSLLLIGESHYLPQSSSQHLNAETWYAGSSVTLSPDEKEWIDTAAILEGARATGFSNKAHRAIWGNPLQEINEYGPRYADFASLTDHIAFYNFFLRPGREGKSLEVVPQDVEFANEAFRSHHQALKPTAIVFLSTLAHKHFQASEQLSVPVIATPHPASSWWNRAAKKYGNKRGRQILADFIKTTRWPQSPDSK